jgi:hypothetical protein
MANTLAYYKMAKNVAVECVIVNYLKYRDRCYKTFTVVIFAVLY